MPDVWQRRIDRAVELARGDARAADVMTTYGRLLGIQRACYDELLRAAGRLAGSVESDAADLRRCAKTAFTSLISFAPPTLAADVPADDAGIDALLTVGWRLSSPPFHARLVLQPYVECLAQLGRRPHGRELRAAEGEAACPFCAGPPQLSTLQNEAGADGGGRALLCATCATSWSMRRVLCVYCGEADEHRLGYFHSPDFPHLRVDVCETCRRYVKTVDLTQLGAAVPLVDEVAAAALDLWAGERGYQKIALNLIGL
jgi:FdhE protein